MGTLPMYRVDWNVFITDQLMDLIAEAAGVSQSQLPNSIRLAISVIFERMGGIPYTEKNYSVDQLTDIGERLLSEATDHVMKEMQPPLTKRKGFVVIDDQQDESTKSIRIVDRVPLNSGQVEQLEELPGIGTALGRRIVEERLQNGPFISVDDVAKRVPGIGQHTAKAIATAVWFDAPRDLIDIKVRPGMTLVDRLRLLAGLQRGQDQVKRIGATFDLLLTRCSAEHHPTTVNHVMRDLLPVEAPIETQAKRIGILENSTYYFVVPQLLLAAEDRIDVCMFHIAFTSEDHPTRQLLDALVQAHAAGVQIRVLLDQDRPGDPYRSTIINTPAKEKLEAAGIQCKFDRTDRLLHSKFIVIDEAKTVVGSHNWSAGSYFHFDDLSLILESTGLAQSYRSRFDVLWSQANQV